MRHPPPVSVRCCGGPLWHGAVAALQGLAAGASAAWLAMMAGLAPTPGLLVGGALLLALTLIRALSRPAPPVALTWDGGCWTVDGQPGSVQVALDLGGWLLLRMRPETPAAADAGVGARLWQRWHRVWLPVSAAEAGPAWHALRVAVHAQAPTAPARPGQAHV